MKTALALLALVTVGCAATPPAIPARTEVVNTACQSFSLIKVPAEDLPKISDTLKARILAHDRAWVKECGKG